MAAPHDKNREAGLRDLSTSFFPAAAAAAAARCLAAGCYRAITNSPACSRDV